MLHYLGNTTELPLLTTTFFEESNRFRATSLKASLRILARLTITFCGRGCCLLLRWSNMLANDIVSDHNNDNVQYKFTVWRYMIVRLTCYTLSILQRF